MRRPFAGWAVSLASVVLDNLREGVLKPDIYDPTLNPCIATCCGTTAWSPMPCRVGDPDRKGLNSYCTS